MCEAHCAACVLGLLGPRPSETLLETTTIVMLNPLRSEDEAFRFLLYAIVVIGAIVAVILILRAIL